MRILKPGQVTNATNPGLVFYHQVQGALVDPFSLGFAIYDISTEEKQLAPVQVYPDPDDADMIELDTSENSADRISKGVFSASFTMPDLATELTPGVSYGQHEVRWYWRANSSDTEREAAQTFDVLDIAPPNNRPVYVLPSYMREQGVPTSGPLAVSNVRLLNAITKASEYIEMVTNRFFEPRSMAMKVDGRGSNAQLISVPIVGIDEIQYAASRIALSDILQDVTSYRVYNRHLSGLVEPDDRHDPKIELYGLRDVPLYIDLDIVFPRGRQNVSITGVFGYTDPDGTPFGCTPTLLQECAARLTLRNLVKLTDVGGQHDLLFATRITSERTRDQAVSYATPSGGGDSAGAAMGAFTGDPRIDHLLNFFSAPPFLGSA